MKNKLQLVLCLCLFLLLCSCASEKPETERIPQATHEQNTELSLPEESEETVFETTEPTHPPHTILYNPAYSTEQIREYFEEVVLHTEYTDGIGDSSLVQKWRSPIGYRIYGKPTEEDLLVLNDLFARLNRIPGFPGFYTAEAEGLEQLRISFLDPETFRTSYSPAVYGEGATGATEYWYYTDTNVIHSARIGYRTDVDQRVRNSVLIEEIVNTLGISDTVLRSDSVTYQYTDDNTALSDVDWILLNLLYHPRMQCGMDAEACAAVLQQIYY